MQVTCLDCGVDYSTMGVDLVLPGEQWRRIVPEEGGILCANCICKRAEHIGAVSILAWINKGGEVQELKEGREYLIRLLRTVAPQVEPLSSLTGLISQIDNYIAGKIR